MIKKLSMTAGQKGFTLVELLVAIAIVAILAVIGLTVFTGLQRGARDAQRRADIEAITRAMEAGYNTTSGTYPQLVTTNFAGGLIPQDPLNGQNSCATQFCSYCITWVTAGAANPAGAQVTNTPTCGNGSGTGLINRSNPFPNTTSATGFVVCANLETGGGNVNGASTGSVFCQGNQR